MRLHYDRIFIEQCDRVELCMLCQLLYLFIHKVTALVEGVTWYPGRVVEVVGCYGDCNLSELDIDDL